MTLLTEALVLLQKRPPELENARVRGRKRA